jgi:hypothetical protein
MQGGQAAVPQDAVAADVRLPGTTTLAHVEENLRAADLMVTPAESRALETEASKITIVGDRYPASLQSLVGDYKRNKEI